MSCIDTKYIDPMATDCLPQFIRPKYRYASAYVDYTIVAEDDKKNNPMKGMPNSYQEDDN